MNVDTMYLTAFLVIGGIIFIVLFFHYVPFFLWLSAKVSGVRISLVQLFLMRIRNVPVSYTHLRAHETGRNLVCRLLLEKKKRNGRMTGDGLLC